MKALLEVLKLEVKDIVTTSEVITPDPETPPPAACEFEACPGLEFDPYAMEG